jgi:hypothetical protein
MAEIIPKSVDKRGKLAISKRKNPIDIDRGAAPVSATTLFIPSGTFLKLIEDEQNAYNVVPSPCPFGRTSYEIVFSVYDEDDWQKDKGTLWADSEWFTLTLGVSTVPLIPLWKGKVPLGSFKAMDSKIICFGGLSPTGFDDSIRGTRDIYKLQLTPHVGNKWVPYSTLKSRRFPPQVSVFLGSKLIVWNPVSSGPSRHWAEVFDPENETCELVPNPPMYSGRSSSDRVILSAVLQNPDRLIVAQRVPDDLYSAIFYTYDLQHRSWKLLEPAKRELPRYRVYGDELWLERPISVNNTLFWVERPIGMKGHILFIAYDLNSDLWLEGHLGLGRFFFPEYSDFGEFTRPSFFHLEKERFCLFQCSNDDHARCIIVEVSRIPGEKTLAISVLWDQHYEFKSKIRHGLHKLILYCDIQ